MIRVSTPIPAYLSADRLAVGEEVIPRINVTSAAVYQAVSGSMRLAYFTCRKTEITTQVRSLSGSIPAAATPTLARIGMYLIDSSDNGTLVAATDAADVSMWAAANTFYTRSWLVPYRKIAGQRYALGALVMTSVTAPNFSGSANGLLGTETVVAPRMGALINGLSDLPGSFTSPAGTNGGIHYMAVLP